MNYKVLFCILSIAALAFTQPTLQECHDHLGTLMDGEGNTLITNECNPFVVGNDQRFEFIIKFLEGYIFDGECLEIQVLFDDIELNEGGSIIDEWTFDPETQEIKFNIRHDDFVSKYGCEWIAEDDQYTWICNFTLNLIFMDEVQIEYAAKLRVTLDRTKTNTLEVDVQKNKVTGICCENELNINTELRFCTTFECDAFLPSPLTIARKEDFFVEQRISTSAFQHYFLELIQVKLGGFFPIIINQDSSEAGRLRLHLRSNIAKQDLILEVISQIHKTAPGGGRRILRMLMDEEPYNGEMREDYKLKSFAQMSVESPERQSQKQAILEESEDDGPDAGLIIGLSVGFGIMVSSMVFLAVYCVMSKRNKMLQQQGNEVANQSLDLSQQQDRTNAKIVV